MIPPRHITNPPPPAVVFDAPPPPPTHVTFGGSTVELVTYNGEIVTYNGLPVWVFTPEAQPTNAPIVITED